MDSTEKAYPFGTAYPHMDEMIKEAGVSKKDITAVAVSIGPGSFTGLRIGLATAKMLSYIWKVPLAGVDTLEALAWNMAGSQAFILPLLDAQRGNVYAALYGAFDEMWQEEKEEAAPIDQVIEAALTHGGPVIAVGECADKYKDKLVSAGIKLAPPHSRLARAGSVAMAGLKKIREGKTDSPLSILPNYIRRSEAEVLWEKQHRKS